LTITLSCDIIGEINFIEAKGNAGTMQKQLLTDGVDKERKGFFSRLFKKD
jgi:hypothetical protein